MKAAQIKTYGGYEIIEIVDIPQPFPKKGQVLVEVYAASINPFDWKIRSGYLKEHISLQFPVTLGGDFSGVITEVGDEVVEFEKGQDVYGTALIIGGGSGAFAQYASANVKNISKRPKSISFEASAALPLVGSSAVQAIEEHIGIQSGQKILIHGGAGGIGHIAIQLAKAHGAYVATTASANDTEYVRSLGADEVIDYKSEQFEEKLKEYDAVYDTVGGEPTNKSFLVLKQGGILLSMLGQPDQKLAEEYGVKAIGQGTHTNSEHLKRLAELIDSKKIIVSIDKIFPLDQVKEAFKYQEEHHPRGKVVLQVKSP